MKTTQQIALARLENNRASAPYSRSSIPRPGLKSGWNLEDTPAKDRQLAPGFADELPAASIARLARVQALTQGSREKTFAPGVCAPAVTFEDFKKIPMKFSPPRFKTQKNGKTVEEKWMLQQQVRSVSFITGNGETKSWKTIARLKKNGDEFITIPPSTGPDGKSFAGLLSEFTRRWGADRAAELATFLRFA